ncbi:hypothetical protein KL909_001738 [Ogataea angusta]|uniref:Maintenance of telomere capping protein 6 n=1 Tax=Pichia angusta TaxID=870730 RepID=A0AAN6I5E8_PICAN|nr:uncharacterized protein KL928_003066 [Ogataea angusta]KAG7818065.1 hypothetical protein KL928_003066 [Ogataea angusta]KAG7824516.1 hypothetical protein KL909_001738 [Ogataea angusta]KAG7828973.1 hypothetical protein KL920_002766 [Ogataea angusta]KAG7834227.1 hypothetical protein KL943_003523 [Ogataea angusta]
MLIILSLFILSALGYPELQSNETAAVRAIAMRTQRDVMRNNSIIDTAVYGIDLNSVVFDQFGYNSSSLPVVRDILYTGVQALVLNLYYNEDLKDWGLCDLSSNKTSLGCQDPNTFNISTVVTSINSALAKTDTGVNKNILFLLLNLFSTFNKGSKFRTGISVLSSPLAGLLYASIPDRLEDLDTINLNNFLFGNSYRVIPVILSNNLYTNTSYNLVPDLDILYEANTSIPITYRANDNLTCSAPKSFQFAFDTSANPYDNTSFHDTLVCGYSPIISQSNQNLSQISDLLPYSLWSWDAFQPNLTISTSSKTKNDSSEAKNDDYLNRCGIATLTGWKAASCHSKFQVACADSLDSTKIELTSDEYTYFEAGAACLQLDGNYIFTVPSSPLEQRTLINRLSGKKSAWIDMNSLSSSNCWVNGGPNAVCPYQPLVSKTIFKEMISLASVIALVLLLLLLLVHMDRLPVHRNRSHWRRLLKQKLQNEFEGVPS